MVKESRLSFEDEISRNKLRSILLIGVMIVFFLILGYIISFIFDPGYFFVIMIAAIIFSLLYTMISYYNSDKIALASVNAHPASSADRTLVNAVENMSIASGLPMPRVYVMPSEQINAFASGRDPQHAVICVTTGAIQKLSKDELEGVIAHEMGHVANYDIRFTTLAAVLIGMIAIMAEIFLRSLWFKSSDSRNNNAAAIFMIIGIVFAILAPIAAQLVQLAISRRREYTADATGVKFTRYPQGLKNALIKIKQEHVSSEDLKRYPKAVAPLFISDPYKKRIQNLFSTHPPIDDRIKKLGMM